MTGAKVDVRAMTMQVTTVPMMSPARPSEKPSARSPVKMSAANDTQ